MYVLVLHFLLLSVTHATHFIVNNFSHSPGIYYDKVNNVKFTNSNWKLVTYLDVDTFDEKIDFVDSAYAKSQKSCYDLAALEKTTLCESSLNLISIAINSLKSRQSELKHLLGYHVQKRGLFNAIGTIFKTLTGVLDNDDAEFIHTSIDKINANELQFKQLLKSQVQIVKSTIQNFNKTMISLNANRKTLNKNIILIQKLAEATQRDISDIKTIIKLEQNFQLLELMISETESELNTLINAILFLKQGSLHPSLISPSQLVKELTNTLQYLPSDVQYPSVIDNDHINELLNVVSLQAFFMKGKLICIINIPLINSIQFELYHLIPLPVPFNDHKYIFIRPSSRYLAVSHTKIQYTILRNLDDCKFLSATFYICKSEEPIFYIKAKPICETELLLHDHLPKSCDKRIVHFSTEIWHKLINKNQWVYLLPESNLVTISCQHIRESQATILSGSGLFELSTKCTAYTTSTILVASSIFSSNYSSVLPKFNITSGLNIHSDKLSNFQLQIIPTSKFNLESLNEASHQLDTVSKLADEIVINQELHKKFNYMLYVLSAICILLLLYTLYRIIKQHFNKNIVDGKSITFDNIKISSTYNAGNPDIKKATAPEQYCTSSDERVSKPLLYKNVLNKAQRSNELEGKRIYRIVRKSSLNSPIYNE